MPADTDRRALDGHFTYRLNTLAKLNDLASQALYAEATGLSLPEVRALAAIGSFDALTVNRLALEVNLDKGQASRLAASMTDKGLLERQADATDKRLVHLSLTRSGRRLWQRVMPLIESRNRALLRCLSEAEQALLLDFVDRLLQQEKVAARG